jgi:hypothetical protein
MSKLLSKRQSEYSKIMIVSIVRNERVKLIFLLMYQLFNLLLMVFLSKIF